MDPLSSVRQALDLLHAAGISAEQQTRFGEPAIAIDTPAGRLVVSLFGAQILEWRPEGKDNIFWLTAEVLHKPGSPIRGGVPLCWPWFGEAHPPFEGPSHGFARRRHWTLTDVKGGETTMLEFCLGIDDAGFRLEARYQIEIEEMLALKLITRNVGSTSCPITSAFHPYFSVRSSAAAVVEMEDPHTPFDRLTSAYDRPSKRFAFTDGETEVQWKGRVALTLSTGSNVGVKIDSRVATDCVAWNPGPIKARQLHDMHPEAYRQFVCVEPCRLDPAENTLAPGAINELDASLKRLV